MKKTALEPCPRCLSLAFADRIRVETVMPLPDKAPPLAIEDVGNHSPAGSSICHDCQSAENLAKVTKLAAWIATEPGGPKRPARPDGLSFAARRVVIGNERQEQLRLPEAARGLMGLAALGYVRISEGEDALERHHRWLHDSGVFRDEEWD